MITGRSESEKQKQKQADKKQLQSLYLKTLKKFPGSGRSRWLIHKAPGEKDGWGELGKAGLVKAVLRKMLGSHVGDQPRKLANQMEEDQ